MLIVFVVLRVQEGLNSDWLPRASGLGEATLFIIIVRLSEYFAVTEGSNIRSIHGHCDVCCMPRLLTLLPQSLWILVLGEPREVP